MLNPIHFKFSTTHEREHFNWSTTNLHIWDLRLDDKQGIDDLKRYLQNSFQTKNLGKLHYFSSIGVARSKESISLSQMKYVLDILEETGLLAICYLENTNLLED